MTANATVASSSRRRRRRTPAAPATVVAYTRVSTEEQAISGAGLAAQRTTIETEAALRGWTIVEWHSHEGISGGKGIEDRPAAAVEAVESGQAGTLIAAKLDRLSRSVLDTALLTDRAKRLGWKLYTCDVAVDTTTPAGEAQARMMTVFSQYERRLIGQRTREALAAKKAAGVRLGRPSVLPVEVIEFILRGRVAGLSYPAIATELNADSVPTSHGGAKWWPATVRNVERGQDAERLWAEWRKAAIA
jgi:DNA invertase Pin-like site-specific DNA recombinase